jgi:hypothetical protein
MAHFFPAARINRIQLKRQRRRLLDDNHYCSFRCVCKEAPVSSSFANFSLHLLFDLSIEWAEILTCASDCMTDISTILSFPFILTHPINDTALYYTNLLYFMQYKSIILNRIANNYCMLMLYML